MNHGGATRPDWLGHAVGAALLTATVLNGLGPYARRVGAIERSSYERYWDERCGPPGVKPVWLGLGRRCVSPERWWQRSVGTYVRTVHDYEWPLKATKDVVVLTLMVFGAAWLVGQRSLGVGWSRTFLPMALGAYVIGSSGVVLARDDPFLALAGLRSFGFLPLALLWASVVTRGCLEKVSRWCVALACVQCALIPWEVLDGIKDKATVWLPLRVAGTMVNPNTLGLVAVCMMGFALSFRPGRGSVVVLWATTLVLVACAGSGVGWFVIVIVTVARLLERVRASVLTKLLGTLALGLLCLSAISFLTGRRDILFSLVDGRLDAFREVIRQDVPALVLGNGLGAGTNAAATFGRFARPSDSTVTMLLQQGGLVGLTLFYATLVQAWYRDRTARPFFLSILVASPAANVIESFPVNLLLGLGLAASLRIGKTVVAAEGPRWPSAGQGHATSFGGEAPAPTPATF